MQAAKILAQNDLSIRAANLDINSRATRNDQQIADATGYTGWDSVSSGTISASGISVLALGADPVATISAKTTSDKYQDFLDANNGLAAVQALHYASAASLRPVARKVGIQSWQWVVGTNGTAYVDVSSVQAGEHSFVEALTKNFSGQTLPSGLSAVLFKDGSEWADDVAGFSAKNATIAKVVNDLIGADLNTTARVKTGNTELINQLAWRFAVDSNTNGGEERPNTVLYSGRDLSLDTDSDISISENTLVLGKRDIVLKSGRDIAFNSNFTADGNLALVAKRNITNTGSDIIAGNSLTASAGGNILNQAAIEEFVLTAANGCVGAACGKKGFSYQAAKLVAQNGGISLTAGGSIINDGGDITAKGAGYLFAGADVINRSKSGKYTLRDYEYYNVKKSFWGKSTTYIADYLETAVLQSGLIGAGGDLSISGFHDLILTGSEIVAGGKADLQFANNAVLKADSVETKSLKTYQKKSGSFFGSLGSKLNSAESNDFTNAFAEIKGNSLSLNLGGSLYAEGAKLKATQGLSLQVAGDIVITPFVTQNYSKVVANSSGFLGTNRNEFSQTINKTVVTSSTADAGRDLLFESGSGDIVLKAAKLNAGGNITLAAKQGTISLLVDKAQAYENTKKHTENLVWWKERETGYAAETIVQNELRAGGKIRFDAGKGLIVEYQENGSVEDSIRTLSKKPELAWLQQLQVGHDVEWRSVKGAYDSWDYKSEGLTQGASAIIAIAVTIATQGLGTEFLLAATGFEATGLAAGAINAGINAGFSTIASRATVSLINNKGDLGKVFKELSSSQFIKSLATSVLTAGLTAGLPETSLTSFANSSSGLSFSQQLQVNIVRNAIGASVSTAINGGKLGDNLSSSLISSAIDTIGAQGAIEIGAAARSGNINSAVQLIAHAALGCGIGAATSSSTGKGCVGGAAGAVIGELAAKWYAANSLHGRAVITAEEYKALKSNGVDLAKLSGAIAAFALGADPNAGAATGANAAKNNALSSLEYLTLNRNIDAALESLNKAKSQTEKASLFQAAYENALALYAETGDRTQLDFVLGEASGSYWANLSSERKSQFYAGATTVRDELNSHYGRLSYGEVRDLLGSVHIDVFSDVGLSSSNIISPFDIFGPLEIKAAVGLLKVAVAGTAYKIGAELGLDFAAEKGFSAVFRGTTEGYLGSTYAQRFGETPASIDPVVATVFATEKEGFGNAVVEIATRGDLKGTNVLVGNSRAELEKEIVLGVTTKDFASKASITISASEARSILGEMGINIPSRIPKDISTQTLELAPRLSAQQTNQFIRRASELAAAKSGAH